MALLNNQIAQVSEQFRHRERQIASSPPQRAFALRFSGRKNTPTRAQRGIVGGVQKQKSPQHVHDAGILKNSWCPGEDSNLHVLQHWYLKPARLPIPPPGQCRQGDVAKPSDRVNGEIMPRQGKKRPAGKGCVVIGLAALPA
jgi:hypothetical protein